MVQIYYSKEKYEVKKYNDGSKYVADKDTGQNVLSRIRKSIIDILDDYKEDIIVHVEFAIDSAGWEEYLTPHIRVFILKEYIN